MPKHDRLPRGASARAREQHQAGLPSEAPGHDEIAALAYQLWQDRGCPVGSPDVDWAQAEASLQPGKELQMKA